MKTELTKKQNEQIKHMIADFPFANVHRAMVATDWKWAASEGTPSIAEMKAEATRMLQETALNGVGNHSTGGFQAIYDGKHFELAFVLDSNHSSDYETEIENEHPDLMES